MSPIAAGLDGLLALLLILALVLGARLNARLKTLREGQAGFAAAVLELNQAAARAESGLVALRTASESAHDELLARIETARGLIGRLERAGVDAQRLAEALPERTGAPARPLAASGSLAAIAALADGRSIDRSPAPADAPEPKPSTPRRPARPAFDEELFETRAPVSPLASPAPTASPVLTPRSTASRGRADLEPLRPHRGDR